MTELRNLSLQIPFPSDLNTDLVVEKGGKIKFKLVSASLPVQSCSERGQFEDKPVWALLLRAGWAGSETPSLVKRREKCWVWRAEGAMKICGLVFAWAGSHALIPRVQQPIDLSCLPGALSLGFWVFFRNDLLSRKGRALHEPPSPVKGFGLLSLGPESWRSCNVEHVSVLCGCSVFREWDLAAPRGRRTVQADCACAGNG